MIRDAKVIGFTGYNRCGKTSTALMMAKAFKKAHSYRKVVVYDPQNKFSSVADAKIYLYEDLEIYINATNTLFIFDDSVEILPDKKDKVILTLMSRRSENCNDFMFMVHNPAQIKEYFSHYITDIYLFNTVGVDNTFTRKLQFGKQLLHYRDIIDSYVAKFSTEEYKALYPNFPFILMDIRNNEYQMINIPVDFQLTRVDFEEESEENLDVDMDDLTIEKGLDLSNN